MQQGGSVLSVLERPPGPFQDKLRRSYGGRPQVPLHEAFASAAEAADAYCSSPLQRRILKILANPRSSGAKAKGLSLPDIAHRVGVEEEVVLRCLVAEYSQWGLFTAVKFKGPGRRSFALAPFADFDSYPPGMQPCTLFALACQALKKAGGLGISLENLRDEVTARGFAGFESMPDDMCDVMLQGTLSGNVAGGSILQLPNGNVALASLVKLGQEMAAAAALEPAPAVAVAAAPEVAVAAVPETPKVAPDTPVAKVVTNGSAAVASPLTTPRVNYFRDAQEKVTPVQSQSPAFATAQGTTPRRTALPVADATPDKAMPSPAILRHVDVPARKAPGPAAVNSVEVFGQGMLRKRTTSVETGSVTSASPRDAMDDGAYDAAVNGAGGIMDSGASSVVESPMAAEAGWKPTPESGGKVAARARAFQGPSIPAGPELAIGPGILKKRDHAPAPSMAAPTPLSPAVLKARPWSPRQAADSPSSVASPVSVKQRPDGGASGLDPVTPPNHELLTVHNSPPHSDIPDDGGLLAPAVEALLEKQPGIPKRSAVTLVVDMLDAPSLTRRLRTKMALESLMQEDVELAGGLDAAIADAMAAFSLATKI